ncbi:hypothetical protein [Anaerobacillus arseniciselenatis]|nr:hypothetical protein [Anaerobacillus arseniciselenatis]
MSDRDTSFKNEVLNELEGDIDRISLYREADSHRIQDPDQIYNQEYINQFIHYFGDLELRKGIDNFKDLYVVNLYKDLEFFRIIVLEDNHLAIITKNANRQQSNTYEILNDDEKEYLKFFENEMLDWEDTRP